MKATYSSIKNNAKSAMNGHIGEVILVGLILPMAFSMISSSLNGVFQLIHWTLPTIISIFTGAISTYIILRMVLKIVRHNSDKVFNNFFGTKQGILNSMILAILSLFVGLGYIIIFWDFFLSLWDIIKDIPYALILSDSNAFDIWIENQYIATPSILAVIISIVYSIIVMIITVRLSFSKYIIADDDLSAIEAIKKSWRITKTNWWRIALFPLSFILWGLLVIITLGVAYIYVVPYIAIARGALYNQLLIESGERTPEASTPIFIKDTIVKEDALDESEDTFDKNDPFESYYK